MIMIDRVSFIFTVIVLLKTHKGFNITWTVEYHVKFVEVKGAAT